jgi:hypothetical protein
VTIAAEIFGEILSSLTVYQKLSPENWRYAVCLLMVFCQNTKGGNENGFEGGIPQSHSLITMNSANHLAPAAMGSSLLADYSSPLPLSFLRRDAAAADRAANPVPKRTTVIGSGMETGAGGWGVSPGSTVSGGSEVIGGESVGTPVGTPVGTSVGTSVGTPVGGSVGCAVGVSAAGT